MEYSFSDKELERYSRNILLKELGPHGQRRLHDGKVLVIGAGGLGSQNLLYLAAAGVGTIGVADKDVIDLSNLQRQVIHDTSSVGEKKTESARRRLLALNPDISVRTYEGSISKDNDALTMQFNTLELSRNSECPVCGNK